MTSPTSRIRGDDPPAMRSDREAEHEGKKEGA